MGPRNLKVLPHQRALAQAAADEVVRCFAEAARERGLFTLALAGGSTPRLLYALLADETFSRQIAWSETHIFWSDERCVPPHHPDSNFRMADQALLAHISIPEGMVHRMRGEDPPREAAEAYERELKNCVGDEGELDLIILGMGADGHTASLFPGTAALREGERRVVANYAPALDSWRLTLTLPCINRARNVVFLVSGEDKSETLARIVAAEDDSEGPEEGALPASLVHPARGPAIWLVDEAAARKL